MDGDHARGLELRQMKTKLVLHPSEGGRGQTVASHMVHIDGRKLRDTRLGSGLGPCRTTGERRERGGAQRSSTVTAQSIDRNATDDTLVSSRLHILFHILMLCLTSHQSPHRTTSAGARRSPGSHRTEERTGTHGLGRGSRG